MTDDCQLALLDMLLRVDAPRTPHVLAQGLHVKPSDVHAGITALSASGCQFDTHPQHGIRLMTTGLGCWADYIESRHQNRIGQSLHVYRETASTQSIARQLVAAAPDTAGGHVVVAGHQTDGRGRLGRRWFAPAGAALLTTLIFRSATMEIDRLSLAACCAVVEAIELTGPITAQIRWPNDVLLNGRKAAGILVEIADHAALIGIGINVNMQREDRPADLRSTAVSLAEVGVDVDRLLLLDNLLHRIHHWLNTNDDALLADTWRQRSVLLQQQITVQTDGRQLCGRVIDIDPGRGLLLDVQRGPVVTLPAMTTTIIEAPGMSHG